MKNLMLTVLLMFSLTWAVLPQDATPSPTPLATVTVTQGFVDDANQAFKLLPALRESIEKFKNERAKTDAEKEAAQILLNSINQVLAIDAKMIDQADKMFEMYKGFILIQQNFIDKLVKLAEQKQKQGFLSKLWNGFRQVAMAILFFYAGRGISKRFRQKYLDYLDTATKNNAVIASYQVPGFWDKWKGPALNAMAVWALSRT